jgi:hypothetical protein
MFLPAITQEVMIGSIVLQVLLAAVVLTKRTWRSYPVFSAYAFFTLFGAAVLSGPAKQLALFLGLEW